MVDWKNIFELSDIKILFYLSEKGVTRYSKLLNDVVRNRSTLANSLRDLQKFGLIGRRVKPTRPIQTEYYLTDKGRKLTELLSEMRKLLQL